MIKDLSNIGTEFLNAYEDVVIKNNSIEPSWYDKYAVKRGLRHADGTGVRVGLTDIGDVHGYYTEEGDKKPEEGRLRYRGINIEKLVEGFQKDKRYGFEETAFLLLFGYLPKQEELRHFIQLLGEQRDLPEGFAEDMIFKAPSSNIMNKLARSVLASYSYDGNPEATDIANVLRQAIGMVARFPTMTAYAYQAKKRYYDGESLYLHSPLPELSTAENLLYMIRPDKKYTPLEAELLDLSLVLHAEHGGGNNSSFTIHVVSSSGTDTYSALAAAVGSLKGPKHGGANIKVKEMMENFKQNISHWDDEEEVASYISRVIKKEAHDKTGLVYGMGHAVYTLSDPRAVLLKEKAESLAREAGLMKEFQLYNSVEKLTPAIFKEIRGVNKPLCANVDFYSGLVYSMLDIPEELYTPIFAIARVAGWCSHRIEELVSGKRIIRPAYKNISYPRDYVPLAKR